APNSTRFSSSNSRRGRNTRYRSSSTRSSAVVRMSRTSIAEPFVLRPRAPRPPANQWYESPTASHATPRKKANTPGAIGVSCRAGKFHRTAPTARFSAIANMGTAGTRGRRTGQHRRGHVTEDCEEETGVDEEGQEEGEEHAAGHTRLRALHLIRQLGDHLEALKGDEQDHGAEDERERPAHAARWDAAGRSPRRQGEETHEDQPYNQENFPQGETAKDAGR